MHLLSCSSSIHVLSSIPNIDVAADIEEREGARGIICSVTLISERLYVDVLVLDNNLCARAELN